MAAGRSVGCVNTVARRRFSSSKTGRRRLSPKPHVPVACEHADAVGVERVECVLDFAQARVDVGQRQGGEEPVAALVIANQLRRVLVDLPRERRSRRARSAAKSSVNQSPGVDVETIAV